MLVIRNDDDEEEPDADENMTSAAPRGENVTSTKGLSPDTKASSADAVIELSDDDDEVEVQVTPLRFSHMRNRYRSSGMISDLRIDPNIPLGSLRLYTVNYPGPQYGLIMVFCSNRVVVKSHQTDNNLLLPTRVGSIIVGINGYLLP